MSYWGQSLWGEYDWGGSVSTTFTGTELDYGSLQVLGNLVLSYALIGEITYSGLTTSGRMNTTIVMRGEMEDPETWSISSSTGAITRAVYQAMSVSANMEVNVLLAAGDIILKDMSTSGTMTVTKVFSGDMTYSDISVSSSMLHNILVTAALELQALSISSSLKVGTLFVGSMQYSGMSISSTMLAGISMSLVANLSDMYTSSTLVLDNTNDIYETIVMNTKTKAFSRYTNHKFNSYAILDGRGFAINSSGLVSLETQNVDGTSTIISCTIQFPELDINNQIVKKLRESYLMYKASHTTSSINPVMTVTLIGDGTEEYEEHLANESSIFIEERIKYGRGLKHRTYSFKITNREGAEVVGESFTVKVEPLNNRTR